MCDVSLFNTCFWVRVVLKIEFYNLERLESSEEIEELARQAAEIMDSEDESESE